MPRNYDATDLLWTFDQDILISNGDIKDTEEDPLRSLFQEVKNRASSDTGSWSTNPTVGSDISDYVGELVNKQTSEAIKTRIFSSLTRHGYILSEDIIIKYIPVSADKLLFRISIKVLPTVRNAGSDKIMIHGLYNNKEDQVTLLF